MLQTIVQRAPGDKPGPDISDPLLSTADAQRARGRGEINENCSSRVNVSGNGPADGYVEPCSLTQVTDAQVGQVRAIIDSCALTIDISGGSLTATSSITFEREQS